MRRYLSRGLLLFLALLLMSCAYRTCPPGPNADLTCETWQRLVDVSPNMWAQGADSWFSEGGVNASESVYRDTSAAMSTMMVSVPNCITDINVSGNFQVQIFGTGGNNSVYLYGSNSGVRGVDVKFKGNMLCLTQTNDASPRDMGCVIVRIGIRNLNSLTHSGCGKVEGRCVRSNCLTISSSGSGNIYLGGIINLKRVTSTGRGCVNVFGAVTPQLDIAMSGSGSVNITGNVGIHCITHHGSGNVNIIGANSDCLTIYTDGSGKIGINGRVDIRQIDARDHTCVYAYYVNGDSMNVYITDYARVGLAGCMRSLNVDAGRSSRFEGHYLYTDEAYVRAHDAGHINVTGATKVFAASTQNSSIYFFGYPCTLTQFFRENGVIIPIPGDKPRYKRGYCPYYKHRHAAYIGD